MTKTPTPEHDHSERWYAETPIFIEALADTTHSSIPEVCLLLQENTLEENHSDEHAARMFIAEYIIDDAA